jgi:hypothetical protein
MSAEDEMVQGYMAGFGALVDRLPKHHEGKSAAWRHGWHNGRDDRLGKPREVAMVLRHRADLITRNRKDTP